MQQQACLLPLGDAETFNVHIGISQLANTMHRFAL